MNRSLGMILIWIVYQWWSRYEQSISDGPNMKSTSDGPNIKSTNDDSDMNEVYHWCPDIKSTSDSPDMNNLPVMVQIWSVF